MKQNCKNLFSYPDGTIFSGKDILKFIQYHTTHITSKTNVASYMQKKFGNIKPDMQYKLFFKWTRCVDAYDGDLVNKPRLLRIDHTSPVFKGYDFMTDQYCTMRYEGVETIKC